ncbi:MAG TPA: hypothetical protein PLF13_10500 [candidate division Zixibacteria bacterium]|nr:hypothetical protein [candidate division Zixibacteria bacterium]
MKKLLIALLSLGLLMTIGCSNNPTDTTEPAQTLDLNDEFGGYLATDEEPAFGDAELAAEAAADEEYDDPILLTPAMDSLTTDAEASLYHLRIVWGMLNYDSTVTDLTDWTGSLTVSRGGIVIRRTIRFELGQDYIPTRTAPELLEWVSFTSVHHDGVAVDIYIPAGTTDTSTVDSLKTPEPVTVSFETGPYSRTFEIDELTALDTVVYLEDSNAVVFQAFKLNHYPCARGFLTGNWGFDEEGNGVFSGLWTDRHGWVTGFVEGSFGVDSTGDKVFFGKWIANDGSFAGLIRGRWDYHPNPHANIHALQRAGGWFAGDIYDADGNEVGMLRGKYKSHPEFKKGFFSARWKMDCITTTDEPEVDDSEDGF